MLRLPISVYSFDKRSKQYAFQHCLQCSVPSVPFPSILTSSAGQCIMRQNLELLKEAMRSPAIVLINGTQVKIYNSSFEEVPALPPTEPLRIIRSYELPYLNLSSPIAHYKLRRDGALALVDTGRLHCAMCYVPETLDFGYVRSHLRCRALSIRKLLRDRRIVVEMGDRSSVFSCETLKTKKTGNSI